MSERTRPPKPKRPSLARAQVRQRKLAAELTLRRDRVFYIATLMATGEWKRRLNAELAGVWGCEAATVRRMAKESSNLLEYVKAGATQLTTLARVRLLQIQGENEQDRVPAWRTLLEHLGELRPKLEVTERIDPYVDWSEEELDEFARTGRRPRRAENLEAGNGKAGDNGDGGIGRLH